MDEYAANALAEIDALLAQQQQDLSIPYSKLAQATVQTITNQSKPIVKMIDKLLRHADATLVAQGDALDAVQTRVLLGLDAYLQDQEYLLQQLAVKGGVIQPGDPLAAALTAEATTGPELAYQGTLVLEIGRLAPILQQMADALSALAFGVPGKTGTGGGGMADLIEVLREIRDRQGPAPAETAGEAPAKAWHEYADLSSIGVTE